MKQLNLSEWALKHQDLVKFFIIAVAISGLLSYFKLGQAEDPAFTFRGMVISVVWPGASARQIEEQVTDKIERKLQETPGLDFIQSFSQAGQSQIFINLRDDVDPTRVADAWYQVRKKTNDIRHTLPEGVLGPFFNDEFGDTYGNVYAFTGKGFSYAELKRYVEDARDVLLKVPDVAKVKIIGEQSEKIYVQISPSKLSQLGIDPRLIIQTLQTQNAMAPAGDVQTHSDQVFLRVTGDFLDEESIRDIGVSALGRTFRLGDIAEVKRGYADPPEQRMRYNGQAALGLAISMQRGGNIIALGKHIDDGLAGIKRNLPIGVEVHRVADQPKVVKESVNEFVTTLIEAIVIVLAVSFWSLGLRSGTVVAIAIPLVLAMVFLTMAILGIDLQKISLGALIISLGLLVDDAIIAVEMMALKMEQGWDRFKAATYAYTSTAMPMLTGTLITVAGFLPVGLAKSAAGEYTFSMFAVVAIALVASWIVAVLFTPYIGFHLLKIKPQSEHDEHAVYQKPFYVRFRALVTWCVDHRKTVMLATAGSFVAAVAGFGFVQQQFFPDSTRPEIVVDMWLKQGASHKATESEVARLEKMLSGDADIDNFATYIGAPTPRFVLVLDEPPPGTNYAQIIVTAKDGAARERLMGKIENLFNTHFPLILGHATRLPNGPPVGYPVQFRVSGPDLIQIRKIADDVAKVVRENPHTRNVNLNWNDMTKALRLEIDQDKARALGVNSQQLAQTLYAMLNGIPVTQLREGDKQVDIVLRAKFETPESVSALKDINVFTGNNQYVPLSQIAILKYEAEEGGIWRRDRVPVINVRADIPDHVQAPTVTAMIDPKLEALRAKLPPGYAIAVGGAQESSSKSQASINAVMPLTVLSILTLLMLQLQSFSRTMLVLLTAPLGIIGVTISLLVADKPFGFVAMLGVIALAGMIMRNSVILVDQIQQDIAAGQHPWTAIVESAVRRFRPIMLTALAAILGMIPLWGNTFWGPMAIAITGGLLVATLLTLLFLPALYAAWFKIQKPV
ncbi:efflux RND transporter permease subunit [Chitinivorax sp. B]|uniref:efflux RND transporter permease subunit n=1 Tax=Chitinivorax sp. B TaxID=2502235 RepID=UPI0010F5C8C5|nr:efflux RND transporter permease subunit [Chitinivorax sp. B]